MRFWLVNEKPCLWCRLPLLWDVDTHLPLAYGVRNTRLTGHLDLVPPDVSPAAVPYRQMRWHLSGHCGRSLSDDQHQFCPPRINIYGHFSVRRSRKFQPLFVINKRTTREEIPHAKRHCPYSPPMTNERWLSVILFGLLIGLSSRSNFGRYGQQSTCLKA